MATKSVIAACVYYLKIVAEYRDHGYGYETEIVYIVGESIVDQCASRLEVPYKIEVLSTFKEIEAIVSDWRELALKEYPGHPFSDPDWIIAWLECFSIESDIRILVVRTDQGISAIVPLVLSKTDYYGIGVRRLGLPFNYHSPRCDILMPNLDGTVCSIILDAIAERSNEWDVFEVPHIATDGTAYEVLHQCTKNCNLQSGEWTGSVSPYLTIEGDWDAYYKSLRGKRRAKLRTRRRRLEEYGSVEIEMLSDENDLELALDDGYRIEAAAWKGENGTAIQSDKQVRAFYTKLAYRMAKRGCLRLFFLTVGGRRVAFAYMLEIENKIFALKQGYEPEFSPMSPSTLLVVETVKYAFENGLKEYDFLGVDDPWKLEWSNALREHRWIMAFSRSPKSRAIYSIKSTILPWYKRVRKVYRSFSDKVV